MFHVVLVRVPVYFNHHAAFQKDSAVDMRLLLWIAINRWRKYKLDLKFGLDQSEKKKETERYYHLIVSRANIKNRYKVVR